MSPNNLGLSFPGDRKRSSADIFDSPGVEPQIPTKKVRFQLDDNPPTTGASNSSASANIRVRTHSDENDPSCGTVPSREVSLKTPELRLPEDLGTMEHPLRRLANTLNEQADPSPIPPPSPRPKALDLTRIIGNSNNSWAPTIPASTAGLSGLPSPDSPYDNRPKLDEDLLDSQIKEFVGTTETDGQEDPNLAQARKNVHAAKVAYQLADFAMEVAREKKISTKGDAHMANIVRRAVARLRAAKEKQEEVIAGGSDILVVANEHVKSNDERDEKGNIWCLGMLGASMRNHCCSDCKDSRMNYDCHDMKRSSGNLASWDCIDSHGNVSCSNLRNSHNNFNCHNLTNSQGNKNCINLKNSHNNENCTGLDYCQKNNDCHNMARSDGNTKCSYCADCNNNSNLQDATDCSNSENCARSSKLDKCTDMVGCSDCKGCNTCDHSERCLNSGELVKCKDMENAVDMEQCQDCKYCFKCVNCEGLRFERRKTNVTKSIDKTDQQEKPAASLIGTKQSSRLVGPSPMIRSVSSRGRETGPPDRSRSSSPPLRRGMRWLVRDTERTTRSESPSPTGRIMSQKGTDVEPTSPPPESSAIRRTESPERKETELTGVTSGSSSMQRSTSSSRD